MANQLVRHYGRGHLHFITFTCRRRLPLLRSVRARNIFVQRLGRVRDRYGFSLLGYVVMPQHIHLLICEPAEATPFHGPSGVETTCFAAHAAREACVRRTVKFNLSRR